MKVLWWVIFVPTPSSWLASRGLALFRTLCDEEFDLPLPEIFAGHDTYSAIGTGSLDLVDFEDELAEVLSREFDGTVYLAYPEDELEYAEDGPLTRRFEGGRELDLANEWLSALSERLRCPLPVWASEEEFRTRSVWVVEGADPDHIRNAIDLEQLYLSNAVLEKIPRGTLMHRPVSGTMGLSVSELSSALPGTTVYELITGPEADRFRVYVHRNGQEVGAYKATGTVHAPPPALPSVLDETEPVGVCAALGVPPQMLGL
jgi:hypothetical protein